MKMFMGKKKTFLLLSILVLKFLSTDGFDAFEEVKSGEYASDEFDDMKLIRRFDEVEEMNPDDVFDDVEEMRPGDTFSELEETISDDAFDELDLEELKAVPFDYYQLVLQWQPATCSNVSCRTRVSPRFSIHGLWAGSNTRCIRRCTGSRFILQNITSIRPQLNRNWPDIIRGNNPALWSHEWNAHGTCFETRTFNILRYFRLALNLFGRSNVLQALQRAGLRPVNGRRYSKFQIESAIARSFRTPALRCNINRNFRQLQLHEVVLCFNRARRNINCPPRFSAGNFCPNSLLWVATTSRVADLPASDEGK